MAFMEVWWGAIEGPIWGAVLVWAGILCLLAAIAVFRGSAWIVPLGRMVTLLALLAVMGALGAAAYYGVQYVEDAKRLEERRALDERAKLLFSQAVGPGSVVACIDGSTAQVMLDACERNLFAGPESVSAVVAAVSQRLAFLSDAIRFGETRDPNYLERVQPMRVAVEADPYGFVAHVLSTENGCSPDSCARFALLHDTERVKENMRVRRFEAYMVKYAAIWKGEAPEEATPPSKPLAIVPGVSISDDMTSGPIIDPTSPADFTPLGAISEPPAAIAAPVLTPPQDEPDPPPIAEADDEARAQPSTRATVPVPPVNAAKQPPARTTTARPKSGAAFRRQSEPVAGLPRVVPAEFLREQQEKEAAAAAAAAARTQGQPGQPVPISPQPNIQR